MRTKPRQTHIKNCCRTLIGGTGRRRRCALDGVEHVFGVCVCVAASAWWVGVVRRLAKIVRTTCIPQLSRMFLSGRTTKRLHRD